MAATSRRIDDIEYLRAVAITYVLIAHLPALFGWWGVAITSAEYWFNVGSGVDLFFGSVFSACGRPWRLALAPMISSGWPYYWAPRDAVQRLSTA